MWLTSNLSGSDWDSSGSLLSALSGYGAYGFGLLFLSTAYLGFLLVPVVFGVKGFLSGSVFTAYLRSDVPRALFRALAELALPGICLLPALLILGSFCMRRSVLLLERRWGDGMFPPQEHGAQPLSAVLILLLLAAALKTYAVPYLMQIF